jgi:hypothetical protein
MDLSTIFILLQLCPGQQFPPCQQDFPVVEASIWHIPVLQQDRKTMEKNIGRKGEGWKAHHDHNMTAPGQVDLRASPKFRPFNKEQQYFSAK